MSKQWDRLIKMLVQANPQDLVSWVLNDAVYTGELNLELLKKPPIFADLLYSIKWKGEKFVLHVEFQREHDDEMGKRVWEYNCLACIHTGLPVYSVVIYLLEDSPIVEPPYKVKLPTGFTVHHFFFENIKLWEIPPRVLKQQKLPGILPLLPLTKAGNSREVVEEMILSLKQANKDDLLPLAYVFSAYAFNGENEQQWLKERFHMIEDFLEDNWAYRDMVQMATAKGMARGLEQGLEQGRREMEQLIVRFVEIRFPDLVLLAKEQTTQTKTYQQLQEIADKLFIAHNDNEAKAALLNKQ